MREDVDHAFNGKRLARVDACDAALCDRGCNDARMCEAGRIELGRVFRGAGDLGAAIDARCGGFVVYCYGLLPLPRFFFLSWTWGGGAPPPSWRGGGGG